MCCNIGYGVMLGCYDERAEWLEDFSILVDGEQIPAFHFGAKRRKNLLYFMFKSLFLNLFGRE